MSRARFREISLVMAEAEEQGCRVELTKNGHFKVYIPNGPMIVCSGTTSDHRGLENAKATLRRAGLNV